MAIVLKIVYQGQAIRIPFDNMPDYAALVAAVKKALPSCTAYSAKYLDDEGDRCTLVESTFLDFLTTAKDTIAGQTVLRAEVQALPVSIPVATDPAAQARKTHGRPRQQATKAVWMDDQRDLDELLQQFAEEPVISKKSRNKKKKKVGGVAVPQQQSQVFQQESADTANEENEDETEEGEGGGYDEVATSVLGKPQLPWTQKKDQVESTETGEFMSESDGSEAASLSGDIQESEMQEGVQMNEAWNDQDASAIGQDAVEVLGNKTVSMEPVTQKGESQYGIAAATCEADDKMLEMHTDENPFERQGHHEDETVKSVLRRASSSPCLSTWRADEIGCGSMEEGSLVAQAWPFVDTDNLTVNLGNPRQAPYVASQAYSWPMQEDGTGPGPAFQQEPAPSSPPCSLGCQQVVWMPVLIGYWSPADSSVAYPAAEVNVAITEGAVPTIF